MDETMALLLGKKLPQKQPTPGLKGWIKDRKYGFLFGGVLLTIALLVQAWEWTHPV